MVVIKKKKNQKDITGNRFGRLTMIESTGESNKHGHLIWKCKCDCGNIHYATGYSLRKGDVKSCGCLLKEWSIESGKSKKRDLTGFTFGLLTVIEQTDKRTSNGSIIWKCKCECGNTAFVSNNRLIGGGTKSCGCLHSRGEQIISSIFNQNNIKFETQKTFENCINSKTGHCLYFDFYLPDYNCCIEYDGVQHFCYTDSGWNTKENFEETKYRDNIKNIFCKDNNIKLIRIPYTDFNKIDIDYLLEKIKGGDSK